MAHLLFAVLMLALAAVCGLGAVRALNCFNDYGSRAAVPLMFALSGAAALCLHLAANFR